MTITTKVQDDLRIEHTVAELNATGARALAGDRFPLDKRVYVAYQGNFVTPVVESVMMICRPGVQDRYALTRRPPGDVFGAGRLHVMGGMAKIGPYMTPIANTNKMALDEMGIKQCRLVAACIARHQWRKGVDHPFGYPLSMLDVYETEEEPDPNMDVEVYPIGVRPPIDAMILDRAGVVHAEFIEIFHRWLKTWKQGVYWSCVDMNATI